MRLFLSLCVATLFLFGAQASDANAGDYGYRGSIHQGSIYGGSYNYRSGNRSYVRPQTSRYSSYNRYRPNYNLRSNYVAPRYYAPSYRRSCGY